MNATDHGTDGRGCARIVPTLLGVSPGTTFTCTCGRLYTAKRMNDRMCWYCTEAPEELWS